MPVQSGQIDYWKKQYNAETLSAFGQADNCAEHRIGEYFILKGILKALYAIALAILIAHEE